MAKNDNHSGKLTTVPSLMVAFLAAGLALTFITFGGRIWWGFELMTHFRVQYVILFILLTVAMVIKRRWVLAGISGVCLAIHLVAILPVYLPAHQRPSITPADPVKILFANVRFKNTHHDRLLNLILQENPHFLVLQEVNNSWLRSLKQLEEFFPYRLLAKNRHHERLVLFSRFPIIHSKEIYYGRYRVPALMATLNINSHELTIYTAHLTSPTTPRHAKARNETLRLLSQEIRALNEPALLVGDLNISPWSPYFYDFLNTTGWKDSRDGFGIQASWPSVAPPFLIPLDHCLVHPSIRVLSRRVGPDVGSDHYPIILELGLPEEPPSTVTASIF